MIRHLTAIALLAGFARRLIKDISQMANLLSAKVVITGLQPVGAITLVVSGLKLPQVLTALKLERGIAALRRVRKLAVHGRG